MNEQFTNTNPEDADFAEKLNTLSEQTNLDPHFANELERKLKAAHKPKTVWLTSSINSILPSLGWVALVVAVGLAVIWSIQNLIPAPQPATNPTISTQDAGETSTPSPDINTQNTTPDPNREGYDFRGAKLTLGVPLPDSPAQAHVYQLKQDQQATLEEARALAERFGIQGELYTDFDYVFNINDYYFTDGKQALQVYSNRRFTYTADLAKTSRLVQNTPAQNADQIISDFLKAHGFDFPMKITATDFFGGYSVHPLTPDGLPVQYESSTFPPMLVFLDENGNILRLEATLMDFDSTPVGTYGMISAQEALNKLLNDNEQGGKTEFAHSAGNTLPQEWTRNYPDNQTVTIHGYIVSKPSADASKPPFLTIDGVPVFGNTAGLEKLDSGYIEATGQYAVENGLRKFNIASWIPNIQMIDPSGILHRNNDQIIFVTDNGKEYPLIDPPADLPLDSSPDSLLLVAGVIVNDKFDWTSIRYFEHKTGGGGGGGGGLGFYKLNLSGTPVPFPTTTPAPILNSGDGQYMVKAGDTLSSIAGTFGVTVDELLKANNITDPGLIYVDQLLVIPGTAEQKVTDLRGTLSIVIHKKADGSQTKEYNLATYQDGSSIAYVLEGSNLNELDAYNALPILVSGTIHHGDIEKLIVDSYEIPFPELKFQILKGTLKFSEMDGKPVTLITFSGGSTYVQLRPDGSLETFITGQNGDQVVVESLAVPDETFGGYPGLRVFSAAVAINPKTGQPTELTITANQPSVVDDANQPVISNYTAPNLTIESVELAYFVSNPYYQVNDPNYSQRSPYIQPVWHFHGHYANGDEFDMLIQALKQEYLLPELSLGITPG